MPILLVVDDSAVDRRLVGGLLGKVKDWVVEYAEHGAEALARLDHGPCDLIITDLIMPELDGFALTAAVKQQHPLVPVILMTSKGSEEIAVKALKTGAAHYSPKANLARDLVETVRHVLAASSQQRTHARLIRRMTRSDTAFIIENDLSLIPALVSYLQDDATRIGLCDDADRVRLGVALDEALINALYHGNLEIKSELRDVDCDSYYSLVDRRSGEEPYRRRRIHVRASISPERGVFVIRDEGPGFDPTLLPDPTDPANLEKLGGRGLLLMRTFMDAVKYNERGNEVTLIKGPSSPVRSALSRETPMAYRYFESSLDGDVLIVTPLRNVGSLAEVEVLEDWERVLGRLDSSGEPLSHVVVDFGQIEYFGSAMIEALLILWKRINARRGRLAVCRCNQVCGEVLRLSRFDMMWPICPTLEEALGEVRR